MKSFNWRFSTWIVCAVLLCFQWTCAAAPGISEESYTSSKSNQDATTQSKDLQSSSRKPARDFVPYKPVPVTDGPSLTADKDVTTFINTTNTTGKTFNSAHSVNTASSNPPSTQSTTDILKHLFNISSVGQEDTSGSEAHISTKQMHVISTVTDNTGADDATAESNSKQPFSKDNSPSTKPPHTAQGMDAILPVEQSHQSNESSLFPKVLLSWMNDTYLTSIIVPIVAGVGCAAIILFSIAVVSCFRRHCCRKRAFRRRNLPEYIKQMTPADRKKLLTESSDDEF